MSIRSDSPLPNSWQWVQVHEVAEAVTGNTPPTADASNYGGRIPFIKPPQLVDALVSDVAESLSDRGAAKARVLPAGAVLVSCIGYLGKTGIAKAPCATNQQINALVFDRPISPEFGFYYAQTLGPWLASASSATTVAIVNKGKFETAPFPLAPPKEQTRIVAKLEELLSDLDAGVAELKAAQKKLTQYRQSLLKAAVEGALTKEWREKRKAALSYSAKSKNASTGSARADKSKSKLSSYSAHPEPVEGLLSSVSDSTSTSYEVEPETGTQLLARILKERRARWEAKQLAKFKEQGKAPPKDWQDKYPEPVKPDTTNLPELPESWVWASLDQLTEFITSGSRGWADYYSNAGATFIRSQNINKDWLDLSDIAFVNPPRSSEGSRTRVQIHDLLLTITGANVGKAAHVNVELEEAYVSQHVALIRPIIKFISDYLHMFLTASAGGRGQLDKEAYGAGKPGLNLQQVGAVAVPLPGSTEIAVLLDALVTQLKAATEQEEFIDRSFARCSAQRKNILKAAFSGQLVPQDPNDEPASVLLDRIRVERATRDKAKLGKKVKRSNKE